MQSVRIYATATTCAAVLVLATGCGTSEPRNAAARASAGSAPSPSTSPTPVASVALTPIPSAASSLAVPTVEASQATAPAVVPACSWNADLVNACELLTEQDVTVAMGKDPGPGRPNPQYGPGECDYGTSPSVGIQLNNHPEGKALFDKLETGGVPVPGIGEAAVLVNGGTFGTIAFVKGTTFVTLYFSLPASASPLHQVTELAKSLAARIPGR